MPACLPKGSVPPRAFSTRPSHRSGGEVQLKFKAKRSQLTAGVHVLTPPAIARALRCKRRAGAGSARALTLALSLCSARARFSDGTGTSWQKKRGSRKPPSAAPDGENPQVETEAFVQHEAKRVGRRD
ncbi:hypothetical protein AAFF_G00436300 [Aldrovandia affinis]|uniref:Uncharacterized protein n=1 Tax=Aldrovandia affinis TaxID=143900 RepID=A0AAD7WHW1_9TELE|nr:hypothetical protein AAFF_G00436300 [Aldrovandia affinis]